MNCSACQDFESQNIFRLFEERETQQDLYHFLRTDLFTILFGAKNHMSER